MHTRVPTVTWKDSVYYEAPPSGLEDNKQAGLGQIECRFENRPESLMMI